MTTTIKKLSKPDVDVPVVDDRIDLKNPTVKREENDTEIEETEQESLLDSVLQTTPSSVRDDGIFGLNVHTHGIGSHDFRVTNDDIVVDEVKSYCLTDPDLW